MDEVDLVISKFLLANSRQPYREIAEKLDLSVNSVHKRVQQLISDNIIKKFRTRIKINAFEGIQILIIGKSGLNSLKELHWNFCRDNRFYWITFGAGNIVYLGGYLRNINELNEVMIVAQRYAELSDVQVGITTQTPKGTIKELSLIDYQILNELQQNSRIKATEIAQNISVSAKTVINHIKTMEDREIINHTIDWFPHSKNDILAFLHIKTDMKRSTEAIMNDFYRLFPINHLFSSLFSNLPDLLFSIWWVDSFQQLNEMREKIHSVDGVQEIEINIMYEGAILDTWCDTYPAEQISKYNEQNKN